MPTNIKLLVDASQYSTISGTYNDQNQIYNNKFSTFATLTNTTYNGDRVFNFSSNKISTVNTYDVKLLASDNFQILFDLYFTNITTNTLFSIGDSSNNIFSIWVDQTSLNITCGTTNFKILYQFSLLTKYELLITRDNNLNVYINGICYGTLTGIDAASIFSEVRQYNLKTYYTVGSKSYSSLVNPLSAYITNIVASFGNTNPISNVNYNTYANKLVSNINLLNLRNDGNIYPYVEAINNSPVTWTYTYNSLGTNVVFSGTNSISTILNSSNFSMYINLSNNTFTNEFNVIKINGNYIIKVKSLGVIAGSTTPSLTINEYTKSALDFENGIVDKVSSTVWNLENTASVQSTNTLYGLSTLSTSVTGDSLYTSSNIITGGSTPYTIEFYALVKGNSGGQSITTPDYPLFSQSASTGDGEQYFYYTNTGVLYYYRGSGFGSSSIVFACNTRLSKNTIAKYTMTYDGSAIRVFVNDMLDTVYGIANGWNNPGTPIYLFATRVIGYENWRRYTSGLLDNFNALNNVATKVRNPDPYEQYLVVDLPFDGANGSTTIVDNGNNVARLANPYNDNIVALLQLSTDITDKVGNIWTQSGVTFSNGMAQFNGSSSKISTKLSSFRNNISDYTIELRFVKADTNASASALFCHAYASTQIPISVAFGLIGSSATSNQMWFGLYNGSSWEGVNTNWTPNANTEYHLAVTKQGTTHRLFIDGTLLSQFTSSSVVSTEQEFRIGSRWDVAISPYVFNGSISDFRIIKGIAAYTTNFTPQSGTFTYITKNKWTVSGSAALSTSQAFDGFSSMNFNLGSISSSIPALNTDDFTISFSCINTSSSEAWSRYFEIGANDTQGTIYLANSATNGETLICDLHDGTKYQRLFTLTPSQFSNNVATKISIVRRLGVFYFYINDILFTINSNYTTTPITQQNIFLGGNNVGGERLVGYIKNFKIYKGVAVIPESSNGKIQLDFDNNVNDKYNNSTWTNSNVTFNQVNSVKGYSAYFNGSTSNIRCGSSNLLNFENKNFTISLDCKINAMNSASDLMMGGSTSNYQEFSFGRPDGSIGTWCNNSTINSSNGFYASNTGYATNAFYNTKLIRTNSTALITLNDVIVTARPISINTAYDFNNSTSTTIGSSYNSLSHFTFNGYIDNFNTYKEDFLTNMDIYKTNSNCTATTSKGYLELISSSGNGIWLKDKDVPYLRNFRMVTYVSVIDPLWIMFRTTAWNNTNDTYAYIIGLYNTGISFAKGSNSTTGDYSPISIVGYTFTANTVYKIELIVNESNITVNVNDAQAFTYSDSTYLNSGLIGFRSYGTSNPSQIYNYTIYDLSGNQLYYKDWVTKIDTVVDRSAVHLPLETNPNNIGFANITVNTVGSPTYTSIGGKKCIQFSSGNYLTINGNNIFNLGTNSDFYIEFDFYINLNSAQNIQTWLSNNSVYDATYSINISYFKDTNNFCLTMGSSIAYYTSTTVNLNQFNNMRIIRKGNSFQFILNNISTNFMVSYNLNLSVDRLWIGKSGWDSRWDHNGYMSNFKLFVGTSAPPAKYNDKLTLDVDFKPTNKSYLFKDNMNKVVLHPINITQRDYQDSQYCCKFDGSTQYIQTGNSADLAFGLDDFYIKIVFKPLTSSNLYSCLIANGQTSATSMDYIMVQQNYMEMRMNNNLLFYSATPGNAQMNMNQINTFIVSRSSGTVTATLNGTQIFSGTANYDFNLNRNSNTYIGKNAWDGTNGFFNGYIYSIKVYRNTSVPIDLYAGYTYTLLDSTNNTSMVFTNNASTNKIRIDKTQTSLSLNSNNVTTTLPITDSSTSNNITLFDNYSGNFNSNILLYSDVVTNDSYTSQKNVTPDYPLVAIDNGDNQQHLWIDNIGTSSITGFIEGHPEYQYNIINMVYQYTLSSGTGDFSINNIDQNYLSEYQLYIVDTNEYLPIDSNMVKGSLTLTVDASTCSKGNFAVKLFRRDTNRYIGTYDIVNGTCTIPYLNKNKRYDAVLFDKNGIIESRTLSNRVPV